MYKPAKVREFVTTATYKKAVETLVNGRTTKTFEVVGTYRGKFKLKGTSEMSANGLTVVSDKTTFTTWYSPNFASSGVLSVNGIDYCIIGTPENVEMRNKYSVLTLERIGGGVQWQEKGLALITKRQST